MTNSEMQRLTDRVSEFVRDLLASEGVGERKGITIAEEVSRVFAEGLRKPGHQCYFCGATAQDTDEAVEKDWVPDFWDGHTSYNHEVCGECAVEHLDYSADGEFNVRPGHQIHLRGDGTTFKSTPLTPPREKRQPPTPTKIIESGGWVVKGE